MKDHAGAHCDNKDKDVVEKGGGFGHTSGLLDCARWEVERGDGCFDHLNIVPLGCGVSEAFSWLR